MSELLALRIALGAATEAPLDAKWLAFHQWLAMRTGVTTRDDNFQGQDIPIRNQEIFETPAIIYQLLHQAFQEETSRTIIIDCSGPFTGQLRGAFQFHLATAIRALTDLDPETPRHVLLTFAQLPVATDIVYEILRKPLQQEKRLLIIDDDGGMLGDGWQLGDDFRAEYAWERRVLRGDVRERLAMKLVKRRGHFSRPNTNRHHQFFYDASKCEEEIVTLLTPLIPRENAERPPMVVYHAPLSPWLEFCATTLATTAGLECVEYRKGLPTALTSDRDIVLLTDFVHTGETFRHIYEHLHRTANRIVPATVLTTLPIIDDHVTLPINGNAVEVHALLGVQQHEMLWGECTLCHVGMPLTDMAVEAYAMLTAYDMWTLHDSSNDKEETEVPPDRDALPNIPNTPAMIKEQASYIAFKLECLLTVLAIPLADLVFVCVDEPGTQVLTQYLRLLLHATVVRIPRTALTADFDRLTRERPAWFVELHTLRAAEVITIDEMKVSGGTFRALRTLIQRFGRGVICEISLIDYSADDPAAPASATLYRLPYAQ